MRGVGIWLLLLLVGCAPVAQLVESEAPNVQFVARVNKPELSYTVWIYVSEPLTVRRMVLQARGFVENDGLCRRWDAVVNGHRCAEGVVVRKAPHGFRLNFMASERPVGNVCLRRLDNEVLFCKNLTFAPLQVRGSFSVSEAEA